MPNNKHTIQLTPGASARFWLEQVRTGATSVKSRNTGTKGPFVDDPPAEDIERIGCWIDTVVPHDDDLTFTFENPGDTKGGRIVIVFNGDTPLIDPRTSEKVYAFELKSDESKTFKTLKKDPSDRRCTTRTCGAKYSVAYLDGSALGTRRTLDPEVIIIH